MKAALISVSSREDTRTSAVLYETAKALADSGIASDMIFLQDTYIHYCTDCGACDTAGACIQKDDLDPILTHIREADIVAVVSPSDREMTAGPMKDFMGRFLRLGKAGSPLVQIPAGKTGAFITVRAKPEEPGEAEEPGEPGEPGNNADAAAVRHVFTDMHIPLLHTFTVYGTHKKKGLAGSPEEPTQAYMFGKEIAGSAASC